VRFRLEKSNCITTSAKKHKVQVLPKAHAKETENHMCSHEEILAYTSSNMGSQQILGGPVLQRPWDKKQQMACLSQMSLWRRLY
jgi:hypothetical protein